MTDSDDPTYRSHHAATDIRLAVHEDEEMMSIRLPIASTGEVRNEGDDPLTREELEGMAEQVNDLTTGVFPEHGQSDMVTGGSGYSQFEKLGYWGDGEVESDASADGEDLLMATARMPDPDTLPDLGSYRQALGILKEQAKRNIPIDASIGWSDDESKPGGVDLWEASVTGIGADPRTSSEASAPVAAMTRAAVEAGADPEALVEAVREALDASEQDEHMTDEDDTDTADDGGTADEAQDADDGETTERADEECPECGHDVRDGANYCSDCGTDLREDDEDGDGADDEDEDEDTQEGDDTDDEDEDDEDRAADEDDDVAELREEVQAMREAHEETRQMLREGDIDLAIGADDLDEDALRGDDADDEQERDTDTDDTTEATVRDGWLSEI